MSTTHTARALPNAAEMATMSLGDLMDTTLRLSDVLAAESEYLDAMNIKELPKLQEEKIRLTHRLEAYQQRLTGDPSFVKQADEKTREELLLVADDLAFTVEENFRKISTAKVINQRVMQAILDVMSEQHRPGTYGRDGTAHSGSDLALSMNLNQKA